MEMPFAIFVHLNPFLLICSYAQFLMACGDLSICLSDKIGFNRVVFFCIYCNVFFSLEFSHDDSYHVHYNSIVYFNIFVVDGSIKKLN